MASYSLPDSPRSSTRTSYPPLLPVYPPPVDALPNPLPSLPPPSPFPNPRFVVSTHLVPASHLRCTPPAPPPPPPAPDTASKEERRVRNAERIAWVEARSGDPHGRYERVLWSAVNRYVRRDIADEQGTGITLFLAHANGFPKETLQYHVSRRSGSLRCWTSSRAPPAGKVDEIWAWEATHHGASCVVNTSAGVPLAACDWSDHTRDVLNFLLHFLPSAIASPGALPVHLPRVAPEESALRKVRGFSNRRLLAVGHSFGGCCSTWAALTHPRLFTALMLVDPVIVRSGPLIDPRSTSPPFIAGAVVRRDTWASREDAHASFAASPFFGAWDPRVLAAYVAHALVASPGSDRRVQLAMPPLQEALVFAGTPSSGPVWDMLPTLDPRVPLRWVVPGKPDHPEIGGLHATRERVWRRPANSSNVRILTAGHLIVQEAPREMGTSASSFLLTSFFFPF
ncbi:hypothetical protein B0H11DRAFT_1701978 [Mycena galericulata]|nr:hypothetical protein B0H11DRAFT_1701978 [Mycena galericulata]